MESLKHLKRAIRSAGAGGLAALPLKVLRSLRRGGVKDLARIARNIWGDTARGEPAVREFGDYERWVAAYDTLTSVGHFELEAASRCLPQQPLVSILMPTYNTRREWLCDAIESVRSQVYGHWELCIADDASTAPHVRQLLQEYAALDPRIRFVVRPANGHICAATNDALALARGEWIALLDHDDTLSADALFWAVKAVARNPQAQMIYSDEDKIDEGGRRFGPYFKPDWNPDLFLAQNLFSHLGMFRTELVRAVGGFRLGFEGSQDYDLALRCAERVRCDEIVHVPRILYHWRVHAESTAQSHAAKPYAISAGMRAVGEHLARTGADATCEQVAAGFRIRYALGAKQPRIALLMYGHEDRARASVQATQEVLKATRYSQVHAFVAVGEAVANPAPDLITLVPGASRAECFERALREISAGDFELVCIFDVGLRPRDDGWLTEMAGYALREPVGAVGPKILRNNVVASAGVLLLPGDPPRPADAHKGYPAANFGYFGRAALAHACAAVRAACMVLRTEVLLRVGTDPFSLQHDAGVEISRRLAGIGLRVVCTPQVEVNAATLQPLPASIAWAGMEQGDPGYNPNLFEGEADFTLAWPPRPHCRLGAD